MELIQLKLFVIELFLNIGNYQPLSSSASPCHPRAPTRGSIKGMRHIVHFERNYLNNYSFAFELKRDPRVEHEDDGMDAYKREDETSRFVLRRLEVNFVRH